MNGVKEFSRGAGKKQYPGDKLNFIIRTHELGREGNAPVASLPCLQLHLDLERNLSSGSELVFQGRVCPSPLARERWWAPAGCTAGHCLNVGVAGQLGRAVE